MKFATLLSLTSGLLTSALAAPLEARVDAQEFDVSDFTAGCLPHGTQCSINFKAATNQQPFQTTCTFTGQPLGASSLPDVGFTACEDPSISFSFRRVTVGDATAYYELALVNAEQNLAVSKFFPATEFPLINAGASVYQSFTGEKLFVVKA